MAPGISMAMQAISSVTSLAGSLSSAKQKMKVAEEQAKKAEELRKKRVMPEKIQQEYKDVANKAQLIALSNIPGIDTAKANLDASQANTVRAIKESSRTGSDRLSSLAMLEGNKMKTLRDLDVTNAEFKVKRQDVANQKQEQIAREKDARREEARLEEQKIRQQADALEVAATANKQNAQDEKMSSIMSAVGSMASMAGGIGGGMSGGIGMLAGGGNGALGGKKASEVNVPEIKTPDTSQSNIALSTMAKSKVQTPNRTELKQTELLPQINTSIDYSKADSKTVTDLQTKLKEAGFFEGIEGLGKLGGVDGIWGPNTETAYKKLLEKYATNR